MKYKKILLISLILFLISLTAVSANDFNDINVNDTVGGDVSSVSRLENMNDELITDNQSSGTFDDLQLDINNVPAGSVLNLTRDYNGHYGSRVHIKYDITIDGQGHTLDCKGDECGAFYSDSGNVILKNLRIINAHMKDYNGGAIHIEGAAQYTLENCTFENCYAEGVGGAIYNGGATQLTIKDCTFKSNVADGSSASYGGAINSNGLLYVENSLFDSNTAKERSGGAICSDAITVINSIFRNNFAQWHGGAIQSSGKSNIKGCIFESNSVDGMIIQDSYGGAISSSDTLYIDNCTFKDNFADDYGGAISGHEVYINYNQNENETYTTFFINNKVDDSSGGAINCMFGDLYMKNAVFTSNRAYVDGGAIYTSQSVTMDQCLFESNVADGAASQCYGGAIRSKDVVFINNSTFKDNTAHDYGGAVYANNVYVNNNQANTEEFNTFFINNKAGDDKGGAVFADSDIHAKNALFEKNNALVDGGAMYAQDNIDVIHCMFDANKANGAKSTRCFGGAFRAEDDAKINNCTFVNNYAENKGGAVYASTVTFAGGNNYFDKNTARDEGGAIYANKFTNDVSSTIFTNNEAQTGDGGAIYVYNENWITFSQCVFYNNRCGDEGGAMYFDSSKSHLKIKYNIFIDNKASKEGQSVYSCGYYDEIYENYWSNNPTTSNDQLIEWKHWPYSNVHHVDSNPLKISLVFSQNPCVVNKPVDIAFAFYRNDGSQCGGSLFVDSVEFVDVENIEFTNKTTYKNSVNIVATPLKTGTYTISAKLFSKTASKDLNVMTQTQLNSYLKAAKKITVTLKSVAVKKSAKKLVLTATLKQGKNPLKKKTIVFKFNGKTYKAKTSSKGIAKYTIKKSILKKLKVGKKVKYQAGYGKTIVKKVAKVKK